MSPKVFLSAIIGITIILPATSGISNAVAAESNSLSRAVFITRDSPMEEILLAVKEDEIKTEYLKEIMKEVKALEGASAESIKLQTIKVLDEIRLAQGKIAGMEYFISQTISSKKHCFQPCDVDPQVIVDEYSRHLKKFQEEIQGSRLSLTEHKSEYKRLKMLTEAASSGEGVDLERELDRDLKRHIEGTTLTPDQFSKLAELVTSRAFKDKKLVKAAALAVVEAKKEEEIALASSADSEIVEEKRRAREALELQAKELKLKSEKSWKAALKYWD